MKKSILIFGMGKTGLAVKDLLMEKNRPFCTYDDKEKRQVDFTKISSVAVSPGISLTHPLLLEAKKRFIPLISEIDLALSYLDNECIGVTGTNGKTTTVTLLTHLFNFFNQRAYALGNIGMPLSGFAKNPDPKGLVILELSSFQLELMRKKRLSSSVLLNISPDHQDRYKVFEDYVKAKISLQNRLKNGEKLFICRSLYDQYGRFFDENRIRLIDLTEEERETLKKLEKNKMISFENLASAYMIGRKNRIFLKDFERACTAFDKISHRMEKVTVFKGITFINDSKATNAEAVIYAVNKIEKNVILIAGGYDKNLDYSIWKESFNNKVHAVFLIGDCAKKIQGILEKDYPVKIAENLENAVSCAFHYAERGDTILLSPGCSSFDQFENYEDRGNRFKRIVLSLLREEK